MLGWLVAGPPVVFAVAVVLREVVAEVWFAVWMRRSDEPARRWATPLSSLSMLPPARGMVVDGELVETGRC